MANDKLKALHTAILDVRDGYRKAIEKAEDAPTADILRQIDDLHRAAHADIHAAISAGGDKPDEDGSLMGTVHKTVISARAAVTGIDRDSLSSFASGEDNVVQAYDEAIEEQSDDPSVAGMLNRHRDALIGMIGKLKAMSG